MRLSSFIIIGRKYSLTNLWTILVLITALILSLIACSESGITITPLPGLYIGTEATGYTRIILDDIAGDNLVDKAFAYVNANPSADIYMLMINYDIEFSASYLRNLNANNTTLLIKSMDKTCTIYLSSLDISGLFTVEGAGCELTMENIILKGNSFNTNSLVSARNGASFIMNSGRISGHENLNGGGGVDVDNATFIMNGGTISGNKAAYGGGVSVNNNAIFIMNGGIISGNEAVLDGGGVYVNSGTFNILNNGIVYGINEGSNSNIASREGAALFRGYGTTTLQYGKDGLLTNIPLIGDARDETINVVDGVLQ